MSNSFPYRFNLKSGTVASIREARAADAKALIDYLDNVSGETNFLTFGAGEFDLGEAEEAAFLEMCHTDEGQLYLVAVAENRIVATLHFAAGRRARVRHSGEFGMSVSRGYWGEGIGSALIDALVAWAKQTFFVKKINLRVRENNERARHLYEFKGFKPEGTLTNEMYVDGKYYDLVAMGLSL